MNKRVELPVLRKQTQGFLDDGAPFSAIADIIESEPEGLFQ